MANTITLTGLTEILYKSRDIVAAEPSAFLNSILMNSDGIERVSLGGTVSSFTTAQPTLNTSYAPSMTVPSGDDQTITAATMTVGQVANVKIPLKGEIVRQLQNTAGYESVFSNMLTQAFRTIRNAIELHIGAVAIKGASRATGTAATTPFASTHASVNAVRQILLDNGAPLDGQISIVLNTLAGTNVRNLSNLYKVNEAGNADMLRKGILQDISGLMLKESAGVGTFTAGAMASATSTSAAFTVGQTLIPLATAGTGVVAAGDVITFANDTNQYVVSAVSFAGANPASGDSITLATPGLRKAQGVATRAITVTATYTGNIGFHRNAIELVIRPPAMPIGGDLAADRATISDPQSGLVYETALYKGYGMNMLDITTFYQAKVWKPDFVATLLG